jgi:energy-coupling factor transport system ATP-binding protein
VTKIFQEAGGKGPSPLTIREGRLWVDKVMDDAGVEPLEEGAACDKADNQPAPKVTDPAITMDNVWFRYDKKSQDVLRGLTLRVAKNQLFCILGGNGVGKSTTLKAISGMLKLQRGKVDVQGKLAMLPQNPQALFTEISVEDELMEALHCDKESDEEKVRAVLDMLALMEITHLRKAHPYDLSGGEQQRLALGKVLLLEPDVVLLDEPTKGLDPFFKITLAGILRKLTENGTTILMVSHDIEFCAEYADQCAMFFDGSVVSIGTPQEFFSGNNFYTTAANKMAREYFPDAITWEEVAKCVGDSM